MSDIIRPSRRDFMRQAACSAVGYGALVGTVMDLYKVNAAAQTATDYKALVALFLYGGNDANNLIVPRGAEYATYAAARGALALPQTTLLPISPLSGAPFDLGLHPSLARVQQLFDTDRKLAFLGNVGPLVGPTNKADYVARRNLPPQLFSHSDQQVLWQTSIAETQAQLTGWGGRTADLLRSLNDVNSISMTISLAGSNTFQVGRDVFQYQVASSGPIGLTNYKVGTAQDAESLAIDRALARQHGNIFENAYRGIVRRALDNDQKLRAALTTAPAMATVFPATRLAGQLKMIAQLIAARGAMGQRRQIFFCSAGGYDTHGNQLTDQANLLTELSDALGAFYSATVELGVADRVTTFTASDFGRTYRTNGAGSDHGWGSHHLVMGGAVNGGRIYGSFPALAVNGPDDTGQGRWIPSTSCDEYSATLAKWFGVSATDMPTILPNIGRFGSPDLGFLA